MDDLVKLTPQNRTDIQKYFNTSPQKINQQIAILRDWIRQQRHFPQNQDDEFLELVLLRNKFRMEQSKTKLENYYTLKGHCREFFEEDYKGYLPSTLPIIGAPMPFICTDLGRLYVLKFRKINDFDPKKMIRFSIICLELLLFNGYTRGEHILLDGEGFTMEHLKRFSFSELQKLFNLYEKAYSGQILSIAVINAPINIKFFMSMMKMFLPPKLCDKVKIHSSNETLLQIYGKGCLPADYGGDLEELETMQSEWDRVFEEKQEFFKFCANNIANEELRVRSNDTFGVNGTFRLLNID